MAAGGTMIRQGKFLLLIEGDLLCNDDKVFGTFLVRADEFDRVLGGESTHRVEGEYEAGMD